MKVFPFSLDLLWYFDGIWTPPSSDYCFFLQWLTMAYQRPKLENLVLASCLSIWRHIDGCDVWSFSVLSSFTSSTWSFLAFPLLFRYGVHEGHPEWCLQVLSFVLVDSTEFRGTSVSLNLESLAHWSFKMAILRLEHRRIAEIWSSWTSFGVLCCTRSFPLFFTYVLLMLAESFTRS